MQAWNLKPEREPHCYTGQREDNDEHVDESEMAVYNVPNLLAAHDCHDVNYQHAKQDHEQMESKRGTK